MNSKRDWGLFAITLAIVLVGALALGVPAADLVFLTIALACPLAMVSMMRGMHGQDMRGGHGPADRNVGRLHDDRTGPGRARSVQARHGVSPGDGQRSGPGDLAERAGQLKASAERAGPRAVTPGTSVSRPAGASSAGRSYRARWCPSHRSGDHPDGLRPHR